MMRNDGTPDNKKFLNIVPCGKTYHFINGKLIESNYVRDQFYAENKHNIYFATTWAEAKRNQLYGRLGTIIILIKNITLKTSSEFQIARNIGVNRQKYKEYADSCR